MRFFIVPLFLSIIVSSCSSKNIDKNSVLATVNSVTKIEKFLKKHPACPELYDDEMKNGVLFLLFEPDGSALSVNVGNMENKECIQKVRTRLQEAVKQIHPKCDVYFSLYSKVTGYITDKNNSFTMSSDDLYKKEKIKSITKNAK
jgi:hypothetical protein